MTPNTRLHAPHRTPHETRSFFLQDRARYKGWLRALHARRPRSAGGVAGVALHCLKLLLSLANNWSCPARRRERRAVASFSGEPQHHPSRPLAPLQQLRPSHSGSRARGEQEEEHAHGPTSVTTPRAFWLFFTFLKGKDPHCSFWGPKHVLIHARAHVRLLARITGVPECRRHVPTSP